MSDLQNAMEATNFMEDRAISTIGLCKMTTELMGSIPKDDASPEELQLLESVIKETNKLQFMCEGLLPKIADMKRLLATPENRKDEFKLEAITLSLAMHRDEEAIRAQVSVVADTTVEDV